MTTTIKDVAARAGLSVMTVSRVLNGERHVSDQARDKVQEAIEALGYRRNVFARGLPGSRSFLIAMLIPEIIPDYVAEFQQGAVEQCRSAGYHLVVQPFDSRTGMAAQAVAAAVASLRPDGFLLIPPVSDDLAVLDTLDEAGVPYARLAPSVQPQRGASVAVDEVEAARAMTSALFELGHRRIGFIGGPPDHGASAWRLEGYRRALAECGLAADPQLIAPGDFLFATGEAGAEALLGLAEPPTAIFAGNDDMALGVMATAQRLGLSVPGDVSVAGFDGGEISTLTWPQLTTVRQPVQAMAAAAADAVIGMVDAGTMQGPARRLDFTLLLRASTAQAA
ncbi:LacI family DNA-binding transcriptional regulator [Phenylobacterium sp.]|uniref:LacI family DNA-binding transcriptional regulator n=1 Tax=Phenylobacterium sp. TaxID=1871053 RepID=UPI0025EB7CF9|nr:LacI family DNA-binding transcriptional regulator [Phenylobacterium sp.]